MALEKCYRGKSRRERRKKVKVEKRKFFMEREKETHSRAAHLFCLFFCGIKLCHDVFHLGCTSYYLFFLCTALYNRYQNSETFLYSIFNGLYFIFLYQHFSHGGFLRFVDSIVIFFFFFLWISFSSFLPKFLMMLN